MQSSTAMLETGLLKKRLIKDESELWKLVSPDLAAEGLSISGQCRMLGISRSGY